MDFDSNEFDSCIGCRRSGREVKLLDALKDGRTIKVCERCAPSEGVLVLRRPSSGQLANPNKSASVYQRLRRMAGIDKEESAPQTQQNKNLFELATRKQGINLSEYSIKKRQEVVEKLNRPANFIDHFSWTIQHERRRRGLSLRQLAERIGESEVVMKMLEEGRLTDDSRKIAEKLEQFFQIKLLKSIKEMDEEEKSKPYSTSSSSGASRILKFDENAMKSLTISDLHEMKKKREAEKSSEKNFDFEQPRAVIKDKNQESNELANMENDFKGEIEFLDE